MNIKHSYSDSITNKRIAIFGHVPPPYGGVAVHIERVMHKLRAQENSVYLFDTLRSYFRFLYPLRLLFFFCRIRPQIVHCHTNDLRSGLAELLILIFLKKLFKCQFVLIEHNCRHLSARTAAYKKNYTRFLKDVDRLVLIGEATQAHYRAHGIQTHAHESVESAFLPPLTNRGNDYPQDLHTFFERHSPIILANASQKAFLNDQDLYGIDLFAQALRQLKKEFPRVGLVVLTQNAQEHYAAMLAAHPAYILQGPYELWPLFKNVDIFVRPTRSDAASVSVEEALHFGVPVIASDAVQRPLDVILFRSGDAGDLCEKMRIILGKKHENLRDYLHPQSAA